MLLVYPVDLQYRLHYTGTPRFRKSPSDDHNPQKITGLPSHQLVRSHQIYLRLEKAKHKRWYECTLVFHNEPKHVKYCWIKRTYTASTETERFIILIHTYAGPTQFQSIPERRPEPDFLFFKGACQYLIHSNVT